MRRRELGVTDVLVVLSSPVLASPSHCSLYSVLWRVTMAVVTAGAFMEKGQSMAGGQLFCQKYWSATPHTHRTTTQHLIICFTTAFQ